MEIENNKQQVVVGKCISCGGPLTVEAPGKRQNITLQCSCGQTNNILAEKPFVGWEFDLGEERTLLFDSTSKLRAAIIDGKIPSTARIRKYFGMGGLEEAKLESPEWKIWKDIVKEGEAFEIFVLYYPVKAYAEHYSSIGSRISCPLGVLAFAVLMGRDYGVGDFFWTLGSSLGAIIAICICIYITKIFYIAGFLSFLFALVIILFFIPMGRELVTGLFIGGVIIVIAALPGTIIGYIVGYLTGLIRRRKGPRVPI